MKRTLLTVVGVGFACLVTAQDGDGRLDGGRDGPAQINLGDRIANSTQSSIHNIDADNDSSSEAFIVARDRFGDVGGRELMRVQEDGSVGIGTAVPLHPLHVENAGSANGDRAMYALASAPTGNTYGLWAETVSGQASRGVFGYASAPTGFGTGVQGRSDGTNGVGVSGYAASATGSNVGVLGQTNSPDGWAGYFIGPVHVSDTLFVGRENTITSAEYFGVNAPVNSGFGGMYISTNGQDGLPFYGYSAGGDVDAYHYVDGASGGWHLYNGGIRLTVMNNGRVGVGTTAPSSMLQANASTGTAVEGRTSETSASSFGVVGWATGTSGSATGVYGRTDCPDGSGVIGVATDDGPDSNTGVYGESWGNGGRGVSGVARGSGFTYGVDGVSFSTNGRGVRGLAGAGSGITWGVIGEAISPDGRGVAGIAHSNSGVNYAVFARGDSTTGYDFYASGAGINYGAASSIRWKENIEPIESPLDMIADIRGVFFRWDEAHGGHGDVGFIAEEVGEVLSEIVNYEENGIDAHGMDYSKMTPLLVEAVNALREEKDAQLSHRDARIASLEEQNLMLRNRVASLEAAVAALMER